MPYRPTELSAREQAQQWYMNHPDAVKRLRAIGVPGNDPALMDPSYSEQNPDIVPIIEEPLQEKKRKYYKQHPEMDPQSVESRIMEFFGLDQPYRNDSRSVDYQRKKWDQSIDEGNPDMSWFMPEYNDDVESVATGSMPNIYGEDDPRSEKDKWAGKIDNFLSFPLLGTQDELVAGLEYLAGNGTYDDKLAEIRATQDAYREWTPVWNQVTDNVSSLPLDAPVLIAGAEAAGKGIQGLKKAAGFAPSTTRLGRALEEVGAQSPAFAGEDALWQMGSGRGNLKDRADQFNPAWTAAAAMFPVWMGAGGLMSAAGSAGIDAGKSIYQRLFGGGKKTAARVGRPPVGEPAPIPKSTMPTKPTRPLPARPSEAPIPAGARPPEGVRDDLIRALQQSRMRDRG